MADETSIADELYNLIKENTYASYSLHLILFFADHPCSRFNELAIIHALNEGGERLYIKQALEELVNKGLVKKESSENILLFSLCEDKSIRRLVLALAQLDISQQRLLFKNGRLNPAERGGSQCQHLSTRIPAICDRQKYLTDEKAGPLISMTSQGIVLECCCHLTFQGR